MVGDEGEVRIVMEDFILNNWMVEKANPKAKADGRHDLEQLDGGQRLANSEG